MQTWKYKIVRGFYEPEDVALNRLGNEGWELVSVLRTDGNDSLLNDNIYYFKRLQQVD
jgi:hypothetical protein